MKSSPLPLNLPPEPVRQDPVKRLSLAVRELDKLINRANQLAHLSEQLFPSAPFPKSDGHASSKELTES
jgi:hypothetical protein